MAVFDIQRNMKKQILSIALAFAAISALCGEAFPQNNAKGYYKDIYMDGGVRLTSKKDLPVARYLGLSLEKILSAPVTKDLTDADTLFQSLAFIGSPEDENGILLYPDGEPRFRMIYLNGGLATQHGRSLTEEGRERIRQYIRNGGSYLGSCAGAFITGIYCDEVEESIRKEYLGIWPGYCVTTGMVDTYTGLFVEEDSPLLRYYDFGGDMYIDSVYHNGGCYASRDENFYPKETEVLVRYDADTMKLKVPAHKEIAAWAYKTDDKMGRVIAIGSHPESKCSDERLDLMAAMVRYAMDGNGLPEIKGELKDGTAREMFCGTSDNNPAFTRIGDRQYHHFTVDVPEGTKSLRIDLATPKGWKDTDMYLFAKGGDFAFMDNADSRNISLGSDKAMIIRNPSAGRLYISVYCATTVDTEETFFGTRYKGRTDVLNGVPYSISVKFQQ